MTYEAELARAITTQSGVFAITAPAELNLYWRCQAYDSLPGSGGAEEQDEGLMRRMTAMANVYEAVRGYLDAIAPDPRPPRPVRKGVPPPKSKFTQWWDSPRNAQKVCIISTLIAKRVMTQQGKLL